MTVPLPPLRIFYVDRPNELQWVALSHVAPSENNVRLFTERTSLAELVAVYQRFVQGDPHVILPDAPIVRWKDVDAPLELLAGERRVTAARTAGVTILPMRVVSMNDEDAYAFILAHNDVAGLTTVELAFRAAEMERLGFPPDEISEAIGGASVGRYLTVGRMVNPHLFSDTAKLCNPSIVEWFEAAEFGQAHFDTCFQHWNEGLWDEKQCAREFRNRGRALPLDNAEKGFRVTRDGSRLVIRGQLDLDVVADENDAWAMLNLLGVEIKLAQERMLFDGHFGPRRVILINPTTL